MLEQNHAAFRFADHDATAGLRAVRATDQLAAFNVITFSAASHVLNQLGVSSLLPFDLGELPSHVVELHLFSEVKPPSSTEILNATQCRRPQPTSRVQPPPLPSGCGWPRLRPQRNQAQWWPFVDGASADWLREQSPALAPPTRTSASMIAAITIATRPFKTPYEPLKKAESRCFIPTKLTTVSGPRCVIWYAVSVQIRRSARCGSQGRHSPS